MAYGGYSLIRNKRTYGAGATHQGSARCIEAGSFDVGQGKQNKAYIRCSFDDHSTNKRYVVKVYMDSMYTPTSGPNKDKTCVPYSVKCFKVKPDGSAEKVQQW